MIELCFSILASDFAHLADEIATAERGGGTIVPVLCGGVIAAGAQVEIGSGGKAVTIASGVARGRAVETGANNVVSLIELY